ncbi:Protein ral2 [Termitomyces sp. J132]|nr:Protein ral2 [Termitomyces sp. J132]
MYLFGGRLVTERKMVSDLYMFDMETFSWEKIPISPDDDVPRARYFHSADTWNNKLIIFGGMSNQPDSINPEDLCVLNDVRFFDIATRHWLPASQSTKVPEHLIPRARYAHLSSVTSDQLFIIGGQDFNNTWLDDVCVYDLVNNAWVLRRDYPRHCGTYRSVAVSSHTTVRSPMEEVRTLHSISTLGPPGQRFGPDRNADPATEFTQSEVLTHLPYSVPPSEEHPCDIYLYSNYNFTDVKRELEVFSPLPENGFLIEDKSSAMAGSTFPPGLRFPTGAILGTNLIIAGTYLAHSFQSFSIWVLDLTNMTWTRIDPGKAVETGSWFRGSLWAEANKFIIFGNRNGNLVDDYNRRLLSWDHVAVIDLEAFGVYQPPPLKLDIAMQELGLAALEERVVADFEIICEDGRRIACSRKILEERWPWFHEQRKLFNAKVKQALAEMPGAIDSPAHLPMPEISGNASSEEPRIDPRLTSRALELSEPYPIVLALLQYFYTTALITPLQHAPAVLSQLLILSTHYKLDHLGELIEHAMHRALSNSTSVGVYEVATLCNCRSLQIRALKTVMAYTQKRPARSRDTDNGKPPGSSGSGPSSGGLGPSGPGSDSHSQQFSRPRGTSDARWRTMGSAPTPHSSGYNTRPPLGNNNILMRADVRDAPSPIPRPHTSPAPRPQSSMRRWRSDSVSSNHGDMRSYAQPASAYQPAAEPVRPPMTKRPSLADLNHLADLMGVPSTQELQTLVDTHDSPTQSIFSVDQIRDNQPTPVPAVAVVNADQYGREDQITPLPVLKSVKSQRRGRMSMVSMHTEQEMHELVDLLADFSGPDASSLNTYAIDHDDGPAEHYPSIITPDATQTGYQSRASLSPSVAPSLSTSVYTATDSDYSDGFVDKHDSLSTFIRNRPPRIFTDSIQSLPPSLTSSVSNSSFSTRFPSPATPLTFSAADINSTNELGIINEYAHDDHVAVADTDDPDPFHSSQMSYFVDDQPPVDKWPQQPSNVGRWSSRPPPPIKIPNAEAESVLSLKTTSSRSTTSTEPVSPRSTGSGGNAFSRLIGRKKDDAHTAQLKEKEKKEKERKKKEEKKEKEKREKEKREKEKQELEKKNNEKPPKETPEEKKARIEQLRKERLRKALMAEPSMMGGIMALA